MEKMVQTRRDDLISLCFLLLHILKIEPLADIEQETGLSGTELYNMVLERKRQQTPSDLCKGSAKCLQPFMNQVFCLDFDEEPFYSKLRHLLTLPLLQL
jgi:hypothetical protein